MDRFYDPPIKLPTDVPADRNTYRPICLPVQMHWLSDVTVGLSTYRPVYLSLDVPTKRCTGCLIYLPTDIPTDRYTCRPIYLRTDIPTYLPTGLPTDRFTPTEIRTDRYVDRPTDVSTYRPIDRTTSLPTHRPLCLPTDLTYLPTILYTARPIYLPTVIHRPIRLPTDLCADLLTELSTGRYTDRPTVIHRRYTFCATDRTYVRFACFLYSDASLRVTLSRSCHTPSLSPSRLPSRTPATLFFCPIIVLSGFLFLLLLCVCCRGVRLRQVDLERPLVQPQRRQYARRNAPTVLPATA